MANPPAIAEATDTIPSPTTFEAPPLADLVFS